MAKTPEQLLAENELFRDSSRKRYSAYEVINKPPGETAQSAPPMCFASVTKIAEYHASEPIEGYCGHFLLEDGRRINLSPSLRTRAMHTPYGGDLADGYYATLPNGIDMWLPPHWAGQI